MAALAVFGSSAMFAQHNFVNSNATFTKQQDGAMTVKERCSTLPPEEAWDVEFNKLVEKFKAEHTDPTGRAAVVNYSIPVVVHVIHGGVAVGTFPNITAAQINSQITSLNNDYAGTGLNVGNVPAVFASLVANTGIQFCMAQTDPGGATLAEPGIHRFDYNNLTGVTTKNPAAAAYNTPATFQSFINTYVKPQTIWDPTKYMNIWVTDENNAVGLLGYATFPAASTLTGLPGGTGTSTTDGLWCWGRAFGTTGTLSAPYNKGRTATHEIGHWLGLRHIWGDNGQCGATDYCVDTPPQRGTTGPPAGCYYGSPTHPQNAGTCTRPDGTAGANVTNTNGDMFMNFMDYTDDIAMYMFTPDQTLRIQTAMANGTHRKFLGTHGICNTTPAAPVAAFTIPATGCTGNAVATTNNSTGTPTPTFAWSSAPATGVSFSNATASAPTITFTTPGTYTISVTATNTQGNNSANQTIVITNCTLTQCDTLMNLADTNTITIYRVPAAQGGGYLSGNNGYGDTHKGEYYTQSGISGSQVTGVITYFYANGAIGTGGNPSGTLAFQLYTGNGTTGPAGTAVRNDNVTLGTIASGGFASGALLAYAHTFSTPYTLAANEFHTVIQLPTTTGDTAVVLSSLFNMTNLGATGWEKWNGAWATTAANYSQTSMAFAIFPIVCPASVGLAASELNSQIAVFPNPSTGVINMAFALSNQSDVKIDVTNMLGQSVYTSLEKAMSAGTKTIDLSHVSKGVYLVTISTGKDKMVRKVVID
ncbi:MAG: hypothetical protein K0S33_2691 [Bacteroidetes bacterium]|nr:hypothetical protein [Bacteroidota bacterium]